MNQRGRTPLDPVRLMMRVLPADGVGAERSLPGLFLLQSRVGLDRID